VVQEVYFYRRTARRRADDNVASERAMAPHALKCSPEIITTLCSNASNFVLNFCPNKRTYILLQLTLRVVF